MESHRRLVVAAATVLFSLALAGPAAASSSPPDTPKAVSVATISGVPACPNPGQGWQVVWTISNQDPTAAHVDSTTPTSSAIGQTIPGNATLTTAPTTVGQDTPSLEMQAGLTWGDQTGSATSTVVTRPALCVAPTTAPTTTKPAPTTTAPTVKPTVPRPTRTRPPGKTVTPGAFCAPEGATGVTKTGLPMLCGPSATDSRNRWRHPGDVVVRPKPTPTRTAVPVPPTPTVTPTVQPTDAPPPVAGDLSGLPNTGTYTALIAVWGTVLLIVGIVLVAAFRRRNVG